MPTPVDHTPAGRPGLDESEVMRAVSRDGLPETLPAEPLPLFKAWFDEAHARRVQPNPNAMTLATIGSDGLPAARIVLCKGMDVSPGGGWIAFHTNYTGRKGRELGAVPHAALVFHWDDLDLQVRMEGPVARATPAESDAYFRSRPWVRRIGAWTSDQSEPIASRAALAAKFDATLRRFGLDPHALPARDAQVEIPRPPHWGGFRLFPSRVELWCGGEGRLHDRAEWTRDLRPGVDPEGPGAWVPASAWRSTRLQP